jgi:hypothetical protein
MDPMKENDTRIWIARLLIGLVVIWNLQCALVFLLHPARFAPGFELTGIPGEAAVRGIAILFVMWNIPYLVAFWHPTRHRLSLWEALVMQAVGLIGESLILSLIPLDHYSLRGSIQRFIYFDFTGLLLLVAAIGIVGIRIKKVLHHSPPDSGCS